MSKLLFLITILNYCDSMKKTSTIFIVVILLSGGCLGIFEEDFDDKTRKMFVFLEFASNNASKYISDDENPIDIDQFATKMSMIMEVVCIISILIRSKNIRFTVLR